MLVGLESEDGTYTVTWECLDLSRDAEKLGPADHAILAALAASARTREGIDPLTVSASEAEKGTRQLFLERTEDFYLPPSSMIGGLMGTIRHSTFDTEHPEFLVEQRYKDTWGSAQIDTFHIPTGTLSDLKTLGFYKVKKMLTGGIKQEAMGYVWQINRQRQLLEANTRYKVEHQHLLIVPNGIQGRVKFEAASLGIAHGILKIDVPRISDEEIVEFYRNKTEDLKSAIRANFAPYCTLPETWGGKKCQNKSYCPVNKICFERAKAEGIIHPYLSEKPGVGNAD